MEAGKRMKRLNRRRFVALATVGVAGTALTACGGDTTTSTNLQPTRIPDVAGAPTLASQATPPNVSAGGGAGAGGGAAQTTVDLEAVDLAFKPADFTIAADTDVTINLKNTGALTHNFYLPKTNFTSKPLPGGESESFKLNLPAGTYDYWCPQPGHKEAGMTGKITVGGAAGAAPAGAAPAGGAAPTTATIDTIDINFSKKELTVAANTDVKITVTNKGVLQHDFHVDKLNITSKLLNSGESDTVTINAKPGTYDYWCTVPGHKEAGMTGKLNVVAAGAAPAGGAASPEAGASPAASPEAGATPAASPASSPQASPVASPAGAAPAAPASGGGGAAATSVDLEAVDLAFKPADFTIAADTDVTINLKNTGALTHNFYLPKTNFTSKPLPGGESESFKLNLPAGTYDYWCPQPGHKEAGMVGKITAK